MLKKVKISEEYERRLEEQYQHDKRLVRIKRICALDQLFNLLPLPQLEDGHGQGRKRRDGAGGCFLGLFTDIYGHLGTVKEYL